MLLCQVSVGRRGDVFRSRHSEDSRCRMCWPVHAVHLTESVEHDSLGFDGLNPFREVVMRMPCKGDVWLGTPCSSWGMRARSWARRTCYRLEGHPASIMCHRVRQYLDTYSVLGCVRALLIRTANCNIVDFVNEQLIRSLLCVPMCARSS